MQQQQPPNDTSHCSDDDDVCDVDGRAMDFELDG